MKRSIKTIANFALPGIVVSCKVENKELLQNPFGMTKAFGFFGVGRERQQYR